MDDYVSTGVGDEDIWDLIGGSSDPNQSDTMYQDTGDAPITTDDMVGASSGGDWLQSILGNVGDAASGVGSWMQQNPKLTGQLASLLMGAGGTMYGMNQMKKVDPMDPYRSMFAGELANMWMNRNQNPAYQMQQQNLGALSNLVNNFWSNPQFTGGRGSGPFY